MARDLPGALLWVLVVVPPAFGFWLVAGDLAGVTPAQRPTLVLASLLTVGVATLGQVLSGYRMTMYEGPGAAYLAAVAAVAAAGGTTLPEVSGGLLAAGALVFLLGLLRVDRLIQRLFTPLVGTAFVLIVCIMVIPAGLERAIERSGGDPAGTAAGWVTLAVVVAVGLGVRRLGPLRPYALLLALIAGTAVYALVGGLPEATIGGGLIAPDALPWGAPELRAASLAPFLLAGVLAAVNAIASINIMAATHPGPTDGGANRRGLLVNGGATAVGAALGNVLGTVPRMDSVAIVQMLDNGRRLALAIASAAILILAFWRPFVDAVAALPLAVSAALLALILSVLVVNGVRGAAVFTPRQRWLALAPAVAPTLAWLAVSPSLGPSGQLVFNPILWGVLLAVALERRLERRPAPAAA